MTIEVLLRYIHFLSILLITATLAAEYVLVKDKLTRQEISRISFIDLIYGLASISVFAAGLTLWLGAYGKPADWYSKNWIFHLKLTLLVIIGLLSIYPTIFFLKNRKGNPDEQVAIPSSIKKIITLELLLLALIPVLAGLMAKGIGFRA
jgi:putative membrane protein